MNPSERSRVLLLMSQRDAEKFEGALRSLDVDLVRAHDLRGARNCLSEGQPIDVVVTDVTLPDGNWSDVLRWLVDAGSRANLVVCTAAADEYLWSEVLWRGGYDILVRPYGPQEARRVIEGAQRASLPTGSVPFPRKLPRTESRITAAVVH